MVILIYFLLLIVLLYFILMKVNIYTFEKYNSDYIKFNGNVKVKGKVSLINNNNNKIQIDRFCITRQNPENPEEEKQTQCMEASTLSFLHNNKDHRLKMICLGNTCIDNRHIKILNGDHDFKLKSKHDGKCLTNDRMRLHNPSSHRYFGNGYHQKDIIRNYDCDKTKTRFGLKWIESPEPDSVKISLLGETADGGASPEGVEMERKPSSEDDVNFSI
jgi:hypothetical protein